MGPSAKGGAFVNWESVLIASIGPVLVIVGLIYQEYRKRKNAREANDATLQAQREPTWNELVTENRNLRTDLGEMEARFDKKMDALERKMDRKITAFENVFRDIFNQWPADHEPPVFNSEDLTELLDNNIPWKNRVRPIPGLA